MQKETAFSMKKYWERNDFPQRKVSLENGLAAFMPVKKEFTFLSVMLCSDFYLTMEYFISYPFISTYLQPSSSQFHGRKAWDNRLCSQEKGMLKFENIVLMC